MPLIHVTVPAGLLDQDARAAVASRLTTILMEIEGTKGYALFAAATWLILNESTPGTIAVGGVFSPDRYQVVIDTPSGALNPEQKSDLIHQVTDALLEIEGVEPDANQRARVYCLINEIPDGGWGFAGQAFTRERMTQLRQTLLQKPA